MERENTVFIPQTTYIYRVVHRVMEGDCQCEHGPMPVTVGPLYADVYPVTNAQYYQFVQDSGYRPEDDRGYLRHWVDGCYKPEDADKPVVWVSLEDARAYAAFYGKRLPKDYEWQCLAAGDECLEYIKVGNTVFTEVCPGDIAVGRLHHTYSLPHLLYCVSILSFG